MCHLNRVTKISLLFLATKIFAINTKINAIFETRMQTETYSQKELTTLRNLLESHNINLEKNMHQSKNEPFEEQHAKQLQIANTKSHEPFAHNQVIQTTNNQIIIEAMKKNKLIIPTDETEQELYISSKKPLAIAIDCARKAIKDLSEATQDKIYQDNNFAIAIFNAMIIDNATIDSFNPQRCKNALIENKNPELILIQSIQLFLNIDEFENEEWQVIDSINEKLDKIVKPSLYQKDAIKNSDIKQQITLMRLSVENLNQKHLRNEDDQLNATNYSKIICAISGLTALEALYENKNDITYETIYQKQFKYCAIILGALLITGLGILLYYFIYQPNTPNNDTNNNYLASSTATLIDCMNEPFKSSSRFGFSNLANNLIRCSKNLFNLTLSGIDNATNIMSSSFLNNVLYKLLQDQKELKDLKSSLISLQDVRYNTNSSTISSMLNSINDALNQVNTTITALDRIRNSVA